MSAKAWLAARSAILLRAETSLRSGRQRGSRRWTLDAGRTPFASQFRLVRWQAAMTTGTGMGTMAMAMAMAIWRAKSGEDGHGSGTGKPEKTGPTGRR
jgi:hypothetical protein